MEQNFDNWNHFKKELNTRELSHIYFKEGDIWWLHLGQNIKSESYGKGEFFSRPVLIIKKLSSDLFIGIPLSTKHKKGSWFYEYTLHNQKYTALLYQVRMFHKNRLQRKLGELDEIDFNNIKKALNKLLEL